MSRTASRQDAATCESIITTRSSGRKPAGLRSPGMLELEELLSEHLSTRVRVEEGAAVYEAFLEAYFPG